MLEQEDQQALQLHHQEMRCQACLNEIQAHTTAGRSGHTQSSAAGNFDEIDCVPDTLIEDLENHWLD